MPACPQCSKPLRELVRRCPSCQADLDLLVDYVSHLRVGLERAEDLTKAGELGQAMWAYLEILEVDPDNAAAKKQVSQVATAVRQFDSAAPGRPWPGRPPGNECNNYRRTGRNRRAARAWPRSVRWDRCRWPAHADFSRDSRRSSLPGSSRCTIPRRCRPCHKDHNHWAEKTRPEP